MKPVSKVEFHYEQKYKAQVESKGVPHIIQWVLSPTLQIQWKKRIWHTPSEEVDVNMKWFDGENQNVTNF